MELSSLPLARDEIIRAHVRSLIRMIQENSEVGFSLASYRREHMFLTLSAFFAFFLEFSSLLFARDKIIRVRLLSLIR